VLGLIRPDALVEHFYGAVLLAPPLVELLEPGDVLLEPMLPLDVAELPAEFGLVAELAEPLTGPEGEVMPPLLSVAAPLFGLAALLGAMLLFELPAVGPLVPESWANATGAKAATDNAKPAPSK
jgi:hypothetical protein